MRIIRPFSMAVSAAALCVAAPVMAKVEGQSDIGFSTLHAAIIEAPPEKVWDTLIAPSRWWNPDHSWTGDADNLYIDPRAGSCFCEMIRPKDQKADVVSRDSVEHMRIIYAETPRILRMSGGLGPLQSEGVAATLNIAMEPHEKGTLISWSYVVGGYMRMPVAELAPAVDGVLGEQLLRLRAAAEGKNPADVQYPPVKADKGADKDAGGGAPAKAPPVKEMPEAKPQAAPAKDTPPPARVPLSERLKQEDAPAKASTIEQ